MEDKASERANAGASRVAGRVLHAFSEGVHVFRYIGRIGYPIAPSLRQHIEPLLQAGGFTGMVFDLSRATAMDSTNLGLLARIGMQLRREHERSGVLVCIRNDLREFLRSMSFHEIFHIVDQHRNDEEGRPVLIETPSEGALLHTMLEAHRTLVGLNEDNEARFGEVVMWLESKAETYQRS